MHATKEMEVEVDDRSRTKPECKTYLSFSHKRSCQDLVDLCPTVKDVELTPTQHKGLGRVAKTVNGGSKCTYRLTT